MRTQRFVLLLLVACKSSSPSSGTGSAAAGPSASATGAVGSSDSAIGSAAGSAAAGSAAGSSAAGSSAAGSSAAGSSVAAGSPPVGSAAAPAAGSGAANPGAAAARSDVCDLAGDYRIRYRSNGDDGYWLRFKVAGTPPQATLTSPGLLLELEMGPIATVADTKSCLLTFTAHNGQVGDLKIVLRVDPKTDIVNGEITRTRSIDPGDSPSAVAGYHDRVPLALDAVDACFVPAIYVLTLDRSHRWRNSVRRDTRPCNRAAEDVRPIYVRVEWLGRNLVIDTVENEPPWPEKVFTNETVTRRGPCQVELTLRDSATDLTAKLTFANQLVGTARIKHQMVVENNEGEDLWNCETTDLPITGKRVATFP
jgi:hypothetical protein